MRLGDNGKEEEDCKYMSANKRVEHTVHMTGEEQRIEWLTRAEGATGRD